jgi:predicted aspartyl protease
MVLLTISGCFTPQIVVRDDYHQIPLQKVGTSVPIVYAKLNDKIAWFIVDTGASATFLNSAYAERYELARRINVNKQRQLSGIGGNVLFETSVCKIQICHLTIRHPVLHSSQMNKLFDHILENEKIPIAGIIGSDILQQYGMNVNFDNNTLTYKPSKKIQAALADSKF